MGLASRLKHPYPLIFTLSNEECFSPHYRCIGFLDLHENPLVTQMQMDKQDNMVDMTSEASPQTFNA